MKKVHHILSRKGNKIISVPSKTTVIDALHVMADNNIGSVLVVDNGEYIGLMSERDYARKIVLQGRSSSETVVAEIMTTDLPTVSPNDSIEHCMQLLSEKNIRYLPVFDIQQLVGIISINDVVKEIMLSQEETISNLKEYLYSNS